MSPLAEHELLQCAIGSGPFKNGCLLLASTYKALYTGVPLPPECENYSAMTIRQVNASLEQAEGQIAEGTLGAVACLAAYEV